MLARGILRLVPAAVLGFGCSSTSSHTTDRSDGGCTAGETRACVGPRQCAGFQTCDPAGRAFSPCDCGGAGGSGGSAATGGSSGGGATGGGGSTGGGGTAGSGGTSGGGAGGTGGSSGAAGSGGSGGASPCAKPVLLIGMEDVTNTNKPGAVIRMSLAGASPARCSDLDAGMPSQPFSVAAIPTDRVAVATWDLTVLIDSTTNRELWRAPLTGTQDYPMDVFPLQSPDGSWLVAVAYSMGPGMIRQLYTYDVQNGVEKHHYRLNTSDLPLGLDWVSMTRHPTSSSHFFALTSSNGAALREIDPFSGVQIGSDVVSNRNLRTVYALQVGGALRVAWVGDTVAPSDAVFSLTQSGVSGPIGCNPACEFAHAVPDPTGAGAVLALCGQPGSIIRRVVRVDPITGTCAPLLDGMQFGSAKRLSRLAIQQ